MIPSTGRSGVFVYRLPRTTCDSGPRTLPLDLCLIPAGGSLPTSRFTTVPNSHPLTPIHHDVDEVAPSAPWCWATPVLCCNKENPQQFATAEGRCSRVLARSSLAFTMTVGRARCATSLVRRPSRRSGAHRRRSSLTTVRRELAANNQR